MMLTLREVLNNETNMDDDVLVELSDRLWSMGDLAIIQKEVSPELFQLHICMNMIGN